MITRTVPSRNTEVVSITHMPISVEGMISRCVGVQELVTVWYMYCFLRMGGFKPFTLCSSVYAAYGLCMGRIEPCAGVDCFVGLLF